MLDQFVIIPFYIGYCIFYCFTFFVYIKYSKLFSNPYYELIKGLAVADILQIVQIIYSSMYGIYINPNFVDTEPGQIVDLLLTVVQYSGTYSAYAFHMSITINRFVAVIFFQRYKQIYTKRNTIILFAFCITLGFVAFSPDLIMKFIHFEPYVRYWFYSSPHPFQYIDAVFSRITTVTLVALSSFACCVSWFKLKRMAVGNRASYKMEIKMLIQSIFISFMLIVKDFVFSFGGHFLPVSFSRFLYFASCATNPIVILIMDNSMAKFFKTQIGKILCFRSSNSIKQLPTTNLRSTNRRQTTTSHL